MGCRFCPLHRGDISPENPDSGVLGAPGAVDALLTFGRGELLYDIRNYAYIEGHIMPMDAEESRHMTKDVGEDGNVDRVNRIMGLTVAAARELLYPLTRESVSDMAVFDDKMEDPGEYAIALRVPSKMSLTTLELLEKLVHEWIVDRVMADWLGITNPEKAVIWAQRAKEAEREIGTVKNTRTGALRRPLQPY